MTLDEPVGSTPYAEVRPGRLADGTRVRVEVLRPAEPADLAAVAERLWAAAPRLLNVDGRHLVRARQVVADGALALVRDDVSGTDLGTELAGAAALPASRAVPLVADVLDALAGLHDCGLVHGALTAGDVLLDTSVPLRTTVRLTGWGVAAVVLPSPPAPADDVMAGARLLVQLLTDRPEGEVPPELVPVLAPALSADPAARPSAAQLRDALRRLQAPRVGAPLSGRLHRPLLAAAAAVAALAVLGLGVLGGRQAADQPVPRPVTAPVTAQPAAPYAFPALQRPDGLVLDRRWVLEEDGAVLRGTTVVRNPTLLVKDAGIDEVVPKSVADDVDDLAFTPGPDAIVERDPVVRFIVTRLQPGESVRWQFVVRLPRPVPQEALARLAADAEAARVDYEQRRARLLEELRSSAAPGAPGPSPTS